MKIDSLAMIETNGLVSALVAVNKMLSYENAKFLKKEVISNGQVTVFVIGNSSEIKRILHAGAIAAQNVGIVISSGIVPYPNEEIEKIIFETAISTTKPKKVKRNIKKKEKVDTLFDQIDDEISFSNLLAEVGDSNLATGGEILIIHEEKENDDTIKDDKLKISSNLQNKDEYYNQNIEIETTTKPSIELSEEENTTNLKEEIHTTDDEFKIDNNVEIDVEIEQKHSEKINTSEDAPDEKTEEIREEKIVLQGMSHIERLRAEAKLEIKSETDYEEGSSNFEEQIPPVEKELKISKVVVNRNETDREENLDSELLKLNVPELRKLARGTDNFPIKGREISKANRKILLEYFAQIR